jgi:hypothetical protein
VFVAIFVPGPDISKMKIAAKSKDLPCVVNKDGTTRNKEQLRNLLPAAPIRTRRNTMPVIIPDTLYEYPKLKTQIENRAPQNKAPRKMPQMVTMILLIRYHLW